MLTFLDMWTVSNKIQHSYSQRNSTPRHAGCLLGPSVLPLLHYICGITVTDIPDSVRSHSVRSLQIGRGAGQCAAFRGSPVGVTYTRPALFEQLRQLQTGNKALG